MDYQTFKDICKRTENIDSDILDACEPYVMENMVWNSSIRGADRDFGKYEFSMITDQAKSRKRIKANLFQCTFEFDSKGRSMKKKLYAKLVRNPNKYIKHLVLKSYYLHYHNLDQPEVSRNIFNDTFENIWLESKWTL